MSENKFNELCLFVDESGLLANLDAQNPHTQTKDVCLVGGVLFWGQYDKVNSSVAQILTETLHDVYSGDRKELHYHNDKATKNLSPTERKNYWSKKNDFIDQIRDKLRREPYGERFESVSIRHEEDLALNRSQLLSENEEDNRYLFMLQSLIEKTIFSDNVSRRLTKDAKIVLRVAKRQLVLPLDDPRVPKIKARLDRSAPNSRPNSRSQRYCEKTDNDNSPTFNAKDYHSEKDVENVVTALLKYRWPNSKYCFETRVDAIEYCPEKHLSQAGYYLADLFLGQKRHNVLQRIAAEQKGKPTPNAESFIVPELNAWTYEPASEELSRCEADLASGGGYFEYLLWEKTDVVANKLFDDFKRKIARQIPLNDLRRHWNRLRIAIDAPTPEAFEKARAVFINLDETTRYRESANEFEDAETEIARAWTRLAVANHSGDVGEGDAVWRDISNLARVYRRLSPEKELEFRTQIGLRHVVNLADSFRFREARETIADLLERQKEAFEFFKSSKFFDDRNKRPILGYCLSQSAQLEAIAGAPATSLPEARRLFEEAATHYDADFDRSDVERNAIYLGHVACDMRRFNVGDFGVGLWAQTVENAPFLQEDENNRKTLSLKHLNNGNRFWAPLLLKGVGLFEDDNKVKALLDEWDTSELKASIDRRLQAQKSEHPDGFVLQAAAELRARVYRKLRTNPLANQTSKAFDDAVYALRREDSPLMNFLASVAQIRKALWLLDAKPRDAQETLAEGLNAARQALGDASFSPNVWKETTSGVVEEIFGVPLSPNASNETKARRLVDSVRFNYF